MRFRVHSLYRVGVSWRRQTKPQSLDPTLHLAVERRLRRSEACGCVCVWRLTTHFFKQKAYQAGSSSDSSRGWESFISASKLRQLQKLCYAGTPDGRYHVRWTGTEMGILICWLDAAMAQLPITSEHLKDPGLWCCACCTCRLRRVVRVSATLATGLQQRLGSANPFDGMSVDLIAVPRAADWDGGR